MTDANKRLWMLLPAITTAGLTDIINQVGQVVLDLLAVLLGATGAPIQELIFMYLLPFVLMFFILEDFIYLMGFFRKVTAKIIAAVLSLFAAHFGVFTQVVNLLSTLLGTGTTPSGLLIPMLTFVFILMAFWWLIGQFIWGFRFTMALNKGTTSVTAAMDALDTIGKRLEKAGGKD